MFYDSERRRNYSDICEVWGQEHDRLLCYIYFALHDDIDEPDALAPLLEQGKQMARDFLRDWDDLIGPMSGYYVAESAQLLDRAITALQNPDDPPPALVNDIDGSLSRILRNRGQDFVDRARREFQLEPFVDAPSNE